MNALQELPLSNNFSDLLSAVQIMRDFSRPWCVCGGWAIDLFVNRLTRPHKDVDFAIWRRDQLAVRTHFLAQGWSVEKIVDGQWLPWPDGEYLELPIHTLGCKHPTAPPGFCEVLLNEVDDEQFLFRRNQAIMRPLVVSVNWPASGIPILAPEIVLLYKANNLSHSGNRKDFESALPWLDSERRAWLRSALQKLYPDHEWLSQL